MTKSNILNNIIKSAKKNYKFILIILLLLAIVILIFVFRPIDRNIETFDDNINYITTSDNNQIGSNSIYGNYVDYTIISPDELYNTTNDNITSITYKLSSIVQIESIGFNNINNTPINLNINVSSINTTTGIIDNIGDIGENSDMPITQDINISGQTTAFIPIIRKARTINKTPVITDTIKIDAINGGKLPCKFLTNICS